MQPVRTTTAIGGSDRHLNETHIQQRPRGLLLEDIIDSALDGGTRQGLDLEHAYIWHPPP